MLMHLRHLCFSPRFHSPQTIFYDLRVVSRSPHRYVERPPDLAGHVLRCPGLRVGVALPAGPVVSRTFCPSVTKVTAPATPGREGSPNAAVHLAQLGFTNVGTLADLR